MKRLLTLSTKENKRVDILRSWEKGVLRVREMGELMDLCDRQVYRVIARYQEQGVKGVVHRLRGRPSNRAFEQTLKARVERLFEKHYRDYGPALSADMLLKNHSLEISYETLRMWFAGQWQVSRKSRQTPQKALTPKCHLGDATIRWK